MKSELLIVHHNLIEVGGRIARIEALVEKAEHRLQRRFHEPVLYEQAEQLLSSLTSAWVAAYTS